MIKTTGEIYVGPTGHTYISGFMIIGSDGHFLDDLMRAYLNQPCFDCEGYGEFIWSGKVCPTCFGTGKQNSRNSQLSSSEEKI